MLEVVIVLIVCLLIGWVMKGLLVGMWFDDLVV